MPRQAFSRVAAASLICVLPFVSLAGTESFTASNDVLLNPERGPMKLMSVDSSSLATLDTMRANGYTIAWGLINLTATQDLSPGSTRLTEIRNWLQRVRNNNIKAVVRVVYHQDASFNSPNEPPLLQMQAHLDDLQQTFTDFDEVIVCYQMGCFGAYGEWFYTPFTSAADRKTIIDKMFDVIPSNAFIQVRTPYYKDQYIAAGGSASRAVRIGFYNDCFMSGDAALEGYNCYPFVSGCGGEQYWKDYIATDSDVVPVGGETCSDVRNQCAATKQEMDYQGWSFINTDWWANAAEGWKTIFQYWDEQPDCGSEMRRKLGYRFELVSATVPDSIVKETPFSVSFTIRNTGYAPLYSTRSAHIKLLDSANNELVFWGTGVDPRAWLPDGGDYTINATLTVPSWVPDTPSVKLALWIPDEDTDLSTIADYSVRIASRNASGQDVWVPVSGGVNILASGIPFGGSTPPGPCVAIDGEFLDWSGVQQAFADPVGDSGAAVSDVTSAWVANDSGSVYLRFQTANSTDFLGSGFNNIFIDTDQNPATGFAIAGIGSELMIQAGSGYDQRGGGFNEGAVSGLALSYSPTGTTTDVELSLSRSATYASDGASVFSGSGITIVLESETTSYVTQELAPDTGGHTYTFASTCGGGGGASWTQLAFDDFESGWGNYSDGGSDAYLYTGGTHAHEGSSAGAIQDNSGSASAFSLTSGIDVTAYSEIKVDFWYKPVSMDNSNENFLLEYWDGTAWYVIGDWARGTDFQNNTFYSESVVLTTAQALFPSDMKIRFRCDASGNADDVYIDEIEISAR